MSQPEPTSEAARPPAATSAGARTVRNVLTNWGAFALNAVIAFVLSPLIVRSLGSDAYGAWILVTSLTGYLGLLDVGVRGAVTKFVATHHAADAHADASRIASAGLVLFGAAGLIAIGTCVLAGYVFLPFFEVPEALRPVAAIVLVLSGIHVALVAFFNVYGGIIVALQRFDRLNAISMGAMVLRALATVAVLALGWGMIGLALVQVAVSALQGVGTVLIRRSVYPEIELSRRDWNRSHIRALVTFGAVSTLLQGSAMVIDYSSTLVIGAYLAVGMITPFSIAATLCLYTRQIISGISYTVSPMVGALEGRRQPEKIRETILVGSRFATLAIAPIVVVFAIRGGTFIGHWMGSEYADSGGAVLRVMSLYVFFFASFQVLASAMVGLNRHRGMVPAFVLEALANIGISILLVRDYGIVGVAWGTTLPRLLNCLLFGPWFGRREVGLPWLASYTQSWLRPALAVVPFALLTAWLEASWPVSRIWGFLLQSVASVPVALAGAWVFAMNADERRTAASTLRSALGLRVPGGAV